MRSNIENQVLSSQQVKYLQELGWEVKDTALAWDCKEWRVVPTQDLPSNSIPTYTLQDMLEILTKRGFQVGIANDLRYYIILSDGNQALRYERNVDFIDAVFEFLCWAIENGYVKQINKV